jgi:hypothetical protein
VIDMQGNSVFYVEKLDGSKNSKTFNARWTVAEFLAGHNKPATLCMFVGGRFRMFVSPDCWGSHTWKRNPGV